MNEAAKNWETPHRVARAAHLTQAIAAALGPCAYGAGLELGCGTGLISLPLAGRFRELYCVDRTAELLDALREKCTDMGISNIFPRGLRFLNDTANRGRFDVAFGAMVFHHMEDLFGDLRRIRGLLKPGGLLVAVDLDVADLRLHTGEPSFRGRDGFDRADFRTVLETCGFQQVQFADLFTGEKPIGTENVFYSLFLCTAHCK